ncbi:hypothetical protein [Curtobacterium flaccumfaciens]|uniref:hypothetical protein n=1 Tax=Curtobacterium flaccumfaciens TaxID=2035 RepID=UPI001889F2EE|nr:hypothetical protein [Curtobacterium flaccumfaciens]MBF4629043.1 hypothetical protein [Curtobacterium flaccumfaciens]
MSDRIPEFTDSYSDDMLFLASLRRILLRHPLENFMPRFLDATLARLYAVMLVGNVENGIMEEFRRTEDEDLSTYLGGQVDNSTKVAALMEFVQRRSVSSVDTSVFQDYLAIKYLRNGIIHSDQRQGAQADYVTSRGFPLDSRELTQVHLRRFAEVDHAITMYLGLSKVLAAMGAVDPLSSEAPVSFDVIARDDAVEKPYTWREFARMHRRNLENVSAIWRRFRDERPGAPVAELMRAARQSDAATLLELQRAGASAEYSWSQLVALAPDDAKRLVADDAERNALLKGIRTAAENKAYPLGPLTSEVYIALQAGLRACELKSDQLRTLFGGPSTMSGAELVGVYALGGTAYDLTSAISVDWIVPVLLQGPSDGALNAAAAFLDLVEIGHTWYSAIEHHTRYESHRIASMRLVLDASRDDPDRA